MIPNFSLEDAPLRANLSIEASAGTGKTYTLEQIVCFLVERYGLGIKQILLVTYTEKAAEELRQRIRRRLGLQLKESGSPIAQRDILQALNQFSEANISTIHSFFRRCLEQFTLETGQKGIAEIDPNAQPTQAVLLDELQKSSFDEPSKRMMLLSGLCTVESKGQSKFQLQKLLDTCNDPNLDNFWRGYADFRLCPGEVELKELERIRQEFFQETGEAYQACCRLAMAPWIEENFANRSSAKKLKNLPQNYNPATALDFFRQLRDLFDPASKNRSDDCKHLDVAQNDRLERLLQLLLEQAPHPKKMELSLAPYIELLCCLHPQNLEQNNEKFLKENGGRLETWPNYEQVLLVEKFFAAFSCCFRPRAQSLQNFFVARFLLGLRRKIAPRLQTSQLLHGIRSFSDMVEGLYRVLVLEQYGDSQSLLYYLRQQYRCVLVDEFQDTDPIQWQILFRIFGEGVVTGKGPCRSHNYIVVGDPKQSIYRFRGASVHLYRLVQRTCDHRFRLSANYRSNSLVLGACNHLFATMWGNPFEPVDAGKVDAPFLRGPQMAPLLESSGLSFLDCEQSGIVPEKSELRQASLEAIEQQVLRLLGHDYQIAGQPVLPGDVAVLMEHKKDCTEIYRHLQALGIPVDYSEKLSVFLDPQARSLHYFFLALCQPRQLGHSLRLLLSPLFGLAVEEAKSLLLLPESDPAPVLGEGLTNPSEFALSFIQQLFRWQERVDQGFLLDVLQELFNYGKKFYRELQAAQGSARDELQQDAYSRLLSRSQHAMAADGLTVASLRELQRRDNSISYNNLCHIVEILASEQLQRGIGCHELSRFIAQQIARAENSEWSEAEQQSNVEEQAVRIMTIHASKGLEFPIVLLGIGLSEGQRDGIVLQTDLQLGEQAICYRQVAYLVGDPAVRERAAQEQYEELQRLFYVALTRASCKIYLPFHSDCKKPVRNLMLLRESLCGNASGDLRTAAEALVQEKPKYFSWEPGTNLSSLGYVEKRHNFTTKDSLLEETNGVRRLQNDNLARRFPSVSSFTSLQHRLEDIREQSEVSVYTADNQRNLGSFQDKERDDLPIARELGLPEAAELCWHELLLSPGAGLGNLLHDVLENTDYQMLAEVCLDKLIESPEFLKQLSLQSRRYFPRNWIQKSYPALCRMIWHTLHCDLLPQDISKSGAEEGQPALRLCQLGKEQREHELEFLLAIPQDCSIDSQLFLQEASGKIEISKGFLKGFIDLLFFHEGKLYLLDWKSNLSVSSHSVEAAIQEFDDKVEKFALQCLQQRLYRPDILQQLMSKHRYQMQYLIYLAAVYCYLKLQYGDTFEYSKHFGGCYYLFLRGMNQKGSGVYFHKPNEERLVQILQELGISGNRK